jgi:hypothetical protein
MVPLFTIITTLITIGVTALLMGVLYRINKPMLRGRDEIADAGPDANGDD